jgi:hypothetical protein
MLPLGVVQELLGVVARVTVGFEFTVTVVEAVAVQPLAFVTVTL